MEAVLAEKEEANSILMTIVLEYDVHQAHTVVMVRCVQTFGHTVYLECTQWIITYGDIFY